MNGLYLLPNAEDEIIDSYDEDIIVTNREGRIIKVTHITGQQYGIPAKDLLGQSVYELEKKGIFSPAITPLVLKQKKKVVVVQTNLDGRKILVTGIPLFNENNEVEYILSYSYEVSELLILQDYLNELEGEMRKVKEELALLRGKTLSVNGIIAESKHMKQVVRSISKVAPLPVSVLLEGENGVGKSLLSKLIHKQSSYWDGPFIEVNCGTIPEAIFEYELLGSTESDAAKKVGYLQMAKNGTLYLQGIDELSLAAQTTLLKGLRKHQNSFRIISSTEESLEELVAQKRFREDLYYLIRVVPIYIKPLRDRLEDLSVVIRKYCQQFCESYHVKKELSEDLFHTLLHLDWKGNYLEVKNVIERLIVQSDGPIITKDDLPFEYRKDVTRVEGLEFEGRTLQRILDQVEKQVLSSAQKRYKTTTEMAKALGISQPSVVRKIKKYFSE
ncbi:sigma 54-interacting transcriptional regulator [Bacillus sp. REN16]|uniref:sigma 54-interacting transcriptional regulator n=1 Tax=Bacillus sp. REN16 TaxID=2887296 RepID=UPI001E620B27|nr:sigma 54-interacting transcriptional regulator [Bacillus sp. REN16]MCC3356801.1 sigma 54-interacting transcriptional regulator [Bacillus sp. REN16]